MADKMMPRDLSRREMTVEQTEFLKVDDIRDLFASFAAAIESDQLSVHALPSWKLHIHYDAGIWLRWRNDHLKFIKKILGTTNEIPDTVLSHLTWLAQNYDPAVVAEVVLELLAEAVSGSVDETELLPAEQFFEQLICSVSRRPTELLSINATARSLAALWFPINDPLRIAADPECGYRVPRKSN
jgi:hypothetical protein